MSGTKFHGIPIEYDEAVPPGHWHFREVKLERLCPRRMHLRARVTIHRAIRRMAARARVASEIEARREHLSTSHWVRGVYWMLLAAVVTFALGIWTVLMVHGGAV